MALYIVN